MKVRKVIYTLVTFLISLQIFGQTVNQSSQSQQDKKINIKWGKPFKDTRSAELKSVLGTDQMGTYLLKRNFSNLTGISSDYKLERLNRELKIEKSSDLPEFNSFSGQKIESVVWFQKQLWLMESNKDAKTKEHRLLAKKVDLKSLESKGKGVEISKHPVKNRNMFGNFNFNISRDSTKLLAFYHYAYRSEQGEQFSFDVLNEQLEKVWSKSINLETKDRLYDIEDYLVSPNGDVVVIGIYYEGSRRSSKLLGEPNYNYEVRWFDAVSQEETIIPINSDDFFITDLKFGFTNEGDLTGAGFYSEEGTYSMKGSAFINIKKRNKSNPLIELSTFDIDFITEGLSDRKAEKIKTKVEKGKNIELRKFNLDRIILRNDGGVVLIAEQFFLDSSNRRFLDSFGDWRTETIYHYNYNDIIVINIDPDGSIRWNATIPKRQYSSEDEGAFSSYSMLVAKGNLYFIFNDHPRNLYTDNTNKRRLDNFDAGRETVTVLAIVNKKGKMKKHRLFSVAESDIYLRPVLGKQVKKNELLIYGTKGRIHKYGKIIF